MVITERKCALTIVLAVPGLVLALMGCSPEEPAPVAGRVPVGPMAPAGAARQKQTEINQIQSLRQLTPEQKAAAIQAMQNSKK